MNTTSEDGSQPEEDIDDIDRLKSMEKGTAIKNEDVRRYMQKRSLRE